MNTTRDSKTLGGETISTRTVPLEQIAPDVLSRGGTITFTATGGSMWPHIRPGDVVTARPLPAGKEPRRGWVIIYRTTAGKLALHRVTGTGGSDLQVRGDAFTGPPEIVPRTAVLGRAVLLQRNGRTFDLTGNYRSALGAVIAWSGSPRVHLQRSSRRLLHAVRKSSP